MDYPLVNEVVLRLRRSYTNDWHITLYRDVTPYQGWTTSCILCLFV